MYPSPSLRDSGFWQSRSGSHKLNLKMNRKFNGSGAFGVCIPDSSPVDNQGPKAWHALNNKWLPGCQPELRSDLRSPWSCHGYAADEAGFGVTARAFRAAGGAMSCALIMSRNTTAQYYTDRAISENTDGELLDSTYGKMPEISTIELWSKSPKVTRDFAKGISRFRMVSRA
ncbi:hypothetical protein B0H14DRAFT_2627370 [Mycena olivaceomarginata]|nr:hypothetical protein B0H14DRAFT_2627370 [Mycena olivaceomarginata]